MHCTLADLFSADAGRANSPISNRLAQASSSTWSREVHRAKQATPQAPQRFLGWHYALQQLAKTQIVEFYFLLRCYFWRGIMDVYGTYWEVWQNSVPVDAG